MGANLNLDKEKIIELNETNASPLYQALPGSIFSDTLVSGLKSGFYCGPFDIPVNNYNPDSDLKLSDLIETCVDTNIKLFDIKCTRINKLFLLQQANKYRVITHLSSPAGNSFNEMVIKSNLRKLIKETRKKSR